MEAYLKFWRTDGRKVSDYLDVYPDRHVATTIMSYLVADDTPDKESVVSDLKDLIRIAEQLLTYIEE